MNEAVNACRELLSGRRCCVFLWGGVGCGKTHLTIATVKAWGLSAASEKSGAKFYWSAEFWKLPDWLNMLRRLYSNKADLVDETVQFYAREIGLLALDDLGIEQATPWASEQLYRVIDARCDNRLAMIVTSNVTEASLDPRIVSRLREGRVVCRSPDVRGKL